MSELDRSNLRDVFVSSYEFLQTHLTRRLGCKALARETLHDMYVRLHRPGEISVLQPRAYLLRMALNVAADNRRSQGRREPLRETDGMMRDIHDEATDLVRAVAARQELEKLEKALQELTPRRRSILLDSRLHGLTLWQIADTLHVSQRLVEMELKAALAHCAQRLERPLIQRFGPQPDAASTRKGTASLGETRAAGREAAFAQ